VRAPICLARQQEIRGLDRAELDRAAEPARAVERGGRAAHHLDPLEQVGVDEQAAVVPRVEVLPHAVEQHGDVGPVEAAEARHLAGAPRAADRFDARRIAQHVVDRRGAGALHLLAADHRDLARVLEGFERVRGRGDGHRLEQDRAVLGERRPDRQRRQRRKRPDKSGGAGARAGHRRPSSPAVVLAGLPRRSWLAWSMAFEFLCRGVPPRVSSRLIRSGQEHCQSGRSRRSDLYLLFFDCF
jgi:hypothetical protein